MLTQTPRRARFQAQILLPGAIVAHQAALAAPLKNTEDNTHDEHGGERTHDAATGAPAKAPRQSLPSSRQQSRLNATERATSRLGLRIARRHGAEGQRITGSARERLASTRPTGAGTPRSTSRLTLSITATISAKAPKAPATVLRDAHDVLPVVGAAAHPQSLVLVESACHQQADGHHDDGDGSVASRPIQMAAYIAEQTTDKRNQIEIHSQVFGVRKPATKSASGR